MARIAGVDLPRNKRVDIALTYIYGIGKKRAVDILTQAEVALATRTDDLSEGDVQRIRKVLDANYRVEGDLRRDIALNIKRMVDLGCYRGIRHKKGLPVRGQRTRTNARTRKGAGAKGRKSAPVSRPAANG